MAQESKPGVLTEAAMHGMARDATGVWALSESGLHALERAFAEVVAQGSETAIPLIRDLANFAHFLEMNQKSPEPAKMIYGIISSLKEVVARLGLELKRVRPESRQESASRFLGIDRASPPGLPAKQGQENDDPAVQTYKPWAILNK